MDEWDYGDLMDTILAQSTALLANRGDEQAVALMIDAQALTIRDTDEILASEFLEAWNSWRQTYHRAAVLDVEDHLIPRFTPDVLDRLANVIGYVAGRQGEPNVTTVEVRPALPEVDANWRETYAARLSAEHPNNQARRERGLPNYPVEDDLTFGSREELTVYRALKQMQQEFPAEQTFSVLPSPGARLREGHTWTPDFVVLGNGRAVVIEIDGPHHRHGRRVADDRNRDLQWLRCGVQAVRLPVEDLQNTPALKARLREELRRNLTR